MSDDQGVGSSPETPDEERERRIDELFAEYLEAVEQGVDREEELLAQAGELSEDLRARIHLERELRALAPERATSSAADAPPQRIGRFRILGLLGKGGISVVYLAHDPDMGRRVALKVLNSDSLLDKQNRTWMLNEARALAQLAHANVVKVLEVGETGTHTYLAMELVTGPSLREVIDELARNARGESPSQKGEVVALAERLRPFSARVAVLRQLADALATCHDQGVLHRDIKPHNVLFDAQGTPRLIDFGLAHDARADEDSRIGLTQNLVGTAAYLAPEQVSGNETGADPRSDQFSLGIVAYELCALTNPFQKGSQRLTMAAIEEAEPPSVRSAATALPIDLALVIHHALERDPKSRYADLRALERDLAAVLEHRPVTVEEPSLAHVARLWLRRHRRAVTIASTAFALFITGSVLLWWADTYTQQRRIENRLDAIRPEEFRHTTDFLGSYGTLIGLQENAREFDRSPLRRLVRPSAVAAVSRTVEAWSQGLDRLFQEKAAAGPVQEPSFQRLFQLDMQLCPEAPWNERYRSRGRVDYGIPPDHEARLEYVETVVGDGGFYPIGRETGLEQYPLPGIYLLRARRPGSEGLDLEASFFVLGGWPPEIRLDLRPRGREFQDALPFDATSLRLGQLPERIEVPSFRITKRVVTVREFRRFLEESGASYSLDHPGLGSRGDLREEDPAIVSPVAAAAYCRFVGGRLPFFQELYVSEDAGKWERGGPFAFGEFVLDYPTGQSMSIAAYVEYSGAQEYRAALTEGRPPSSLPLQTAASLDRPTIRMEESAGSAERRFYGAAFRVAFSSDSWSTYERLSEFHPSR
ncbi:MAG: protein kinase [Planctomycetota bacterium]